MNENKTLCAVVDLHAELTIAQRKTASMLSLVEEYLEGEEQDGAARGEAALRAEIMEDYVVRLAEGLGTLGELLGRCGFAVGG